MMKVHVQLALAPMPIAVARDSSGKISPPMSHGIGPRPTAKKPTKARTPTSDAVCSAALPPSAAMSSATVTKTQASSMPEAERRMRKRRPLRSMRYTETPVATALTTPTSSVPTAGFSSPASLKKDVEYWIMPLMPLNCCPTCSTNMRMSGILMLESPSTARQLLLGFAAPGMLSSPPPWLCPFVSAAATGADATLSFFSDASSSSTASSEPAPRSATSALRAAASSPWPSNHAGDRDISGAVRNCSAPSGAVSASRYLQPGSFTSGSTSPRQLATMMPITMAPWLHAPNAPRSLAGATSVRYIGTTTLPAPLPSPASTRPRLKTTNAPAPSSSAEAHSSAPASTKKPLLTVMKRRRPTRSAKSPPTCEPRKPPTENAETAMAHVVVDIPSVVVITFCGVLITPMLKPN
mmetsp:Transcript_27942/g.96579  ORF Transcript_27942/g.96579 Transcript_27942/m.96579 type:complete len:409 (+) Transcript_27942:261-1487(+)